MVSKKFCFNINSYNDAVEILNFFIKEKKVPIFFIKYYLINGLGIDWLIELRNMLQKKFKYEKFQIYTEIKRDYGIFISLVENNIDYIKVQADNNTLKRLNEIAKINKVLINPNFSVIHLTKFNNRLKKLKKIIQ